MLLFGNEKCVLGESEKRLGVRMGINPAFSCLLFLPPFLNLFCASRVVNLKRSQPSPQAGERVLFPAPRIRV